MESVTKITRRGWRASAGWKERAVSRVRRAPRSVELLRGFDHDVIDVRLGELAFRVTGEGDAHPRRLAEPGDRVYACRSVSSGRVAQVQPGLSVVLGVVPLELVTLAHHPHGDRARGVVGAGDPAVHRRRTLKLAPLELERVGRRDLRHYEAGIAIQGLPDDRAAQLPAAAIRILGR